jgi:NodT family efflux transporter outer membrane factor (OMF) lipoprotein
MRHRHFAICSMLAAAGCTAGPDFVRPGLAPAAGYVAAEPGNGGSVAAGSQQLMYGSDVSAHWWELFQNAELDALMQQAIKANPDLASAQASLRQARELALAESGGRLPSASASVAAERGRAADTGIYNLSSLALGITYEVDAAGGKRRAVEAAQAAAESQAFAVEAAYLTLTAGLVKAVIEEASLREQIHATEEIISSLQDLLNVLQLQVEVGVASNSDLLQQQAVLKQTQANLPGLIKSWEQQRNAIAVLAGEFPGNYAEEPFTLDGLKLPRTLPVSLPAALIRQRPDIRSSEALLHQASANIGVAAAERMPQISLTATIGSSTTTFGSLFSAGTFFNSVAAGLSQSLFDGGVLRHTQRAAEAAFDAALADYRSVVLSAFGDVADVLRAIQRDGESLSAYIEAEEAARASLDLARLRFKVGTGDYTDVLSAQQTYQEARISRAEAEADRYLDAAALFEALGGGWWNRPENILEPAPAHESVTVTGATS